MKYIRNTTDFYIEENTVLSLGKFDGIHRGHEQLLQYFAKKKDEGLAGAIFTFDIPPRRNVQNVEAKVLTTNEEKRHMFERLGIMWWSARLRRRSCAWSRRISSQRLCGSFM